LEDVTLNISSYAVHYDGGPPYYSHEGRQQLPEIILDAVQATKMKLQFLASALT
jgi:hypothetical protein